MKFIGLIPARYASTRFPGKPLVLLGGMTVVERVYRRVSEVFDEVYVCTDDQRILDAVHSFGGRAVMTRADHRSGTDRCYEAFQRIGSDADVVVNIQGDEPFIHSSQLLALQSVRTPECLCCTSLPAIAMPPGRSSFHASSGR